MAVPEDRRYSLDHHWVQADASDGTLLVVGLTDFAQEALGEVTLIQLADIGAVIDAGAEMGEVEAFKAMTDIYMPVAATVVELNPVLVEAPTTLNNDPYGAGWLCRIRPARTDAVDTLLTANSYNELIGVS